MVKRKIVWTSKAKNQLFDILEYFIFRNKSKIYSQKLYQKIQSELLPLIHQPNIGKKTNTINVRGIFIENYFIFYETNENHIIILSVWDTRQNSNRLRF